MQPLWGCGSALRIMSPTQSFMLLRLLKLKTSP
jgi:hypothetical protein